MENGWQRITPLWFQDAGPRPQLLASGLWLDGVYRTVWFPGGPKFTIGAEVLFIDGTAVQIEKLEAKGVARASSRPEDSRERTGTR